jgi:8-oxo-dGTP pyrophosphatase MutT (NUDIX family)
MFTSFYPERKSVRALLFEADGTSMIFHGVQRANHKFPFYTTFGGGIEAGESPEQALVREMKEELDAEVIVGREVLALPGQQYFVARVISMGDEPFTHGPEFQGKQKQKNTIKKVSYRGSYSHTFNLQPRLLKSFIEDFSKVILKELEAISPEQQAANDR